MFYHAVLPSLTKVIHKHTINYSLAKYSLANNYLLNNNLLPNNYLLTNYSSMY